MQQTFQVITIIITGLRAWWNVNDSGSDTRRKNCSHIYLHALVFSNLEDQLRCFRVVNDCRALSSIGWKLFVGISGTFDGGEDTIDDCCGTIHHLEVSSTIVDCVWSITVAIYCFQYIGCDIFCTTWETSFIAKIKTKNKSQLNQHEM